MELSGTSRIALKILVQESQDPCLLRCYASDPVNDFPRTI